LEICKRGGEESLPKRIPSEGKEYIERSFIREAIRGTGCTTATRKILHVKDRKILEVFKSLFSVGEGG